MKPTEQQVLDAIDMDGLLTYLCDLVAMKSICGDEVAVQEHVAAQMKRIGLDVDMWEIDFDELSKHPAYGVEVQRTRGLGLVGTMGKSEGGRSLILNGHVDIVSAGDESRWQYPPYQGTVVDGRVYGRGALDMKGGLCCALFAAKAIQDAGVQLKGKLMIESVIGEEDGGVGTLATVLRGYKADGAIIMEPTELIVAPAQAGALSFRVTIPGLSAHGAMREEGVSAIEKFIPVFQALLAFEKERNARLKDPLFTRYELPYALSIGKLIADNWPSSVTENLYFEGRYGVAVGEELAAARQAFEAAVAQAALADDWLREHPPLVEWWGAQFAPAAIPIEHPILMTVNDAFYDATGEKAKIEGMTYGADMRLLVNEGQTPTVLFGPGDVRHAHRPDEFVPVADLKAVTQTLALTVLRFCGYE
jgi:acetylornithine deacetylase